MLKKRIIPKLLLRGGRTVKGVRFGHLRDVGHPVTNARIYDAQGADELMFLDITATLEGRMGMVEVIRETSQQCFMPLAAGGGVTGLDDFRRLLESGADKVVVNTAAISKPWLIGEAARLFGSQCVVAAIDVRRGPDGARVYARCGGEATDLWVKDWARELAGRGAGEILVNSVDRDGTGEGYDLECLNEVISVVHVPVIVSGGAGTLAHFTDAFSAGASAVAVGSLFHFTDQSPIKARAFVKQAGFPVRKGS